MKKVKRVLILILIPVTIYLAFSLWVSVELHWLIGRANQTRGVYDPSVSVYISENLYGRLNTNLDQRYVEEYYIDVNEKNWRTFPLTWHTFTSAKSVFWYTTEYTGYNEEGKMCRSGSRNIPVTVTLKLEGWKWVIIDKYEAP